MHTERPRARRYPFKAKIEITDLQSETLIRAQTDDLTLYGCQVKTVGTLAMGTMVWLKIIHTGGTLEAHGRVTSIRPDTAFGIAFTKVDGKKSVSVGKVDS